MRTSALDVRTTADGSVVVSPHGMVGPDNAVELRRLLVHTVRRLRPLRLVFDLADVSGLDPINVGTLAAACDLGDDCHVSVFLDNSSDLIAEQLTAAGVPRQRLRHTTGRGRPSKPADATASGDSGIRTREGR
jgi:anti-anti-sigma regulatory factor